MSVREELFDTSIRIRYKSLPLNNMLWPLLDIGIESKGVKIPQKIFALVDSGASNSIIHIELAQVLGFDLSKLRKRFGGLSASGSYEYWSLPGPINLDIYGRKISVNFQVINYPALIWPCILGHDSIFKCSKILFKTFKGYFDMSFRLDIN